MTADRTLLTFWFDCEDYVSGYEPTSLLRLTDIFARVGLRATWKLVGEEVRMLQRAAAGGAGASGRDAQHARQALAQMAAQGIGFHTDWHSVHPTVAEYCAGAGWTEGQERFAQHEAPGVRTLHEAFPDAAIACYGQPGGAWAPQAYPVLRRWGIPLYMDEAGHLGLNEQPFYYCGVLNVLRLRQLCVGSRGNRPPSEDAASALRDVDRLVGLLRERGGGLAQCWWHPNEWYTDQWWDGLNFGGGRNHVTAAPHGGTDYRIPEPLGEKERDARYAATADFIAGVARRDDLRVVGAREIVALYPDRARGRTFSPTDLARIAEGLSDTLTFQSHDGYTLSAAEAAYLLATALSRDPSGPVTLDVGPDGPGDRVTSEVPASATVEQVRAAAAAFTAALRTHGCVPTSVPLAGGRASPECAAAAFAAAYPRAADLGANITLHHPRLAAESYVGSRGMWNWSIFAPGFDAPDLIDLGRLQTWTLKPAVLAA